MITEDYVSFEIAKLLKDKGFDELCSKKYNCHKSIVPAGRNIELWQNSEFDVDEECSAPTFQMAMKWIRDIHNLDIIVPPQFDNSKWTYSSIIFKLSIPCTEIRLNDNKDKKEEAYEAAIKYCLENLI